MPTTYPWIHTLSSVVPANGVANVTVQCPVNNTLYVKRWLWTATSALFNLIDVNINNSIHPVEASATIPILGAWLQQVASPNFNIDVFDPELVIPSNAILTIVLQDKSGAPNTVTPVLIGRQDYP